MKSLKLNEFKQFSINGLNSIKGGQQKTSWKSSSGASGKDAYADNDGDCTLSAGDDVLLDNGQWIVYS